MTKSKLILCNQQHVYKEEMHRRRNLRLLQVREQSKQNAATIRNAFKKEKEKHIKVLQNNIQDDFIQRKEEQIEELQDIFVNRMRHFGEGHELASNYDDKTEVKIATTIENEAKAQHRGNNALKVHRVEQMIKENKENAHIISRQFALEQEKLRASEVAKLPPKIDELNKIVEKNVKLVAYHDANAFMTTRYHMPETIIDKATNDDNNKNANEDAVNEEVRIKEAEIERQRVLQENKEKARLRGKHALEKEILNENYENILDELDVMEKADRDRRQKELLNIPKEIFLPPWQRQQEKNEKQLDLEREFEKIYVNADLRQDMPEPVNIQNHELSSNFDSDLDLTVLENKENEILNDCDIQKHESIYNKIETPLSTITTNGTSSVTVSVAKTSTESTISKNVPTNNNSNLVKNPDQENALKKLLQKIHQQREDMNNKNSNKDVDLSQNTPVSTPKHASPLIQPETPAYVEMSHADSTLTSLESGTISEESKSEISDNLTEITQNKLNLNQNKYASSSIYSKNISSLENYNYKNNNINDEVLSTIGPQYSVDLSHASKDPMVAGTKELFNKNEIILTYQEKKKEILKKYKEIEEKKKALEQTEKEIKYHEMKSASSISEKIDKKVSEDQQQQPLVMSGKCTNTNLNINIGDSTDRSSQRTIVSTYGQLTATPSNIDEQKIREYQKTLLQSSIQQQQQQQQQDFDLELNIELRKKEILQRFGITDMTNFNKFNNEKHIASSIAQLSEDKYTISTDSGFASWRNQHQLRTIKPNTQRSSSASIKSTINSNKIQQTNVNLNNNQDTSFESNVDQLEHDNTTVLMLQQNNSSKKQASKIFGLEYFDSQNSEIRDSSIEKLIGLMESQNTTNSRLSLNKSNSSLNDLKQTTLEFNNNRCDTLYESSLSSTSLSSVNNHENEINKQQQQQHHSYNTDDESVEFSITSDDYNDSGNIIMSLLNSRKDGGPFSDEDSEIAKRIIEELAKVRAEQEQMLKSQHMLKSAINEDDNDENNAYIHNSNNIPLKALVTQKMKPPVKSYRAVECNPHELSTIKEENNTPMSEKTIRRFGNMSNGNSIDLTSSMDYNNRLTEQVLDESNEISMRKICENNETKLSNNDSITSFKSLSPSKSFDKSQNQTLKRKNNRVAFNLSLFDPGSSIDNSLYSPTLFNNNNNNNNNNNSSNDDYNYNGGIYDTSSIVTSTQLENTELKTVLTNETTYQSINIESTKNNIKSNLIQKTLKQINNDARKKWFDILSADDESSSKSIEIKQKVKQEEQLSFKSLDETTATSISNSNSSLSHGLIRHTNDEDSMLSVSSSTSEIIRPNRKIASKSSKSNQNNENKLDVSNAQTNLSNQKKIGLNIDSNINQRKSPIEITKELKLHVKDNGNLIDKTLKQHSPPIAIQKEIIKNVKITNLEKDLNVLHSSENKKDSFNSSGASQKSIKSNHSNNDIEKQNNLLNDLFIKNAASIESYSKQSLLDEPELSFVSIKTNSNVNSPMRDPMSTPANGLRVDYPQLLNKNQQQQQQSTSIQQNFAAYLLHKNELFKRFSNISPIEPLEKLKTNLLHSSNDSTSSASSNSISTSIKTFRQNQNQQQEQDITTATPRSSIDNKNLSFKSLNRSETATKQQFLTLTAEKTSIFSTTNDNTQQFMSTIENKQKFDSYLSTGGIEQTNLKSSIINASNLKSLASTTNNNNNNNEDMHLTIQFENEHMIMNNNNNKNDNDQSTKNSSIIELSQIENLLNNDRNLIRTPASCFNDETLFGDYIHGKSDSLMSFERHEKSAADTMSSKKSSVSSPYNHLIEETLELDEQNEEDLYNGKFIMPTKSSRSPINQKTKQKNDSSQNFKQPKSFKSQQFTPKTSELSPCLQKVLKNSLENRNSTRIDEIDDSSVTQVTLLNNQNFDKTDV